MPTIKEIEYRGHDTQDTTIKVTSDLLDLKTILENTAFNEEIPSKRSLKSIKQESFSFYNRHYSLHDIPFTCEKSIGPFKIELNGLLNPFSLPISKVKINDSFYGLLNETLIIGEQIKLVYRGISLSKNITDLTSLAYTHEISHTQVNNVCGLIKYYYNSEILSIFNELLAAYEKQDGEKLLQIHDRHRLEELRESISVLKDLQSIDEDIIEASCYCASTLKAYYLFSMYYYGDQLTRDSIINQIQKTFNHQNTLEENLSELGVPSSELPDSTYLKKYLHR